MPDDPQRAHGDAPDGARIDDAGPAITPLDDETERSIQPLYRQRPRRVTVRRSLVVAGLALVIVLVVVLSAGGLWPQIGVRWQAAHRWLHAPTLQVQSPVPWAQVWVDGHLAGSADTPLSLGLGAHTVTVRATGFAPYTRHLSFGDTLQAMHQTLSLAAPVHILPGTVAQMEAAINRALDAAYGANSTTAIAPGEEYAPGQVAPAPLQGRLTLTMVTGGPLFTCASSSPDPACAPGTNSPLAGTPSCLAPPPDTLCLTPYLALLSQPGTDSQQALVNVRAQLEARFTNAATGRLIHTTIVPPQNYQGELLTLWPAHHGWQIATTFMDTSALTDFQTRDGLAELQALLLSAIANAMLPFDPQTLNPPSDGVVFDTVVMPAQPPAPSGPMIRLFHLGMLFAANESAHRVTPQLPLIPPALALLVA
jgi:hypothetical protein